MSVLARRALLAFVDVAAHPSAGLGEPQALPNEVLPAHGCWSLRRSDIPLSGLSVISIRTVVSLIESTIGISNCAFSKISAGASNLACSAAAQQ
jgi:hypothetical protein